jgi:hypothetical protein
MDNFWYSSTGENMQRPIYASIEELVSSLLKQAAPAYAFYEVGDKTSLFMVNPAAKQIFYLDKLHRPLLPFQLDSINQQLPPDYSVTDISRIEASRNILNPHGFHSSQPMFDDKEKWVGYAKQKIEGYSRVQAAEVGELVIERIQIATPPNSFFAKSATRETTAAPRDTAGIDANAVPPVPPVNPKLRGQ